MDSTVEFVATSDVAAAVEASELDEETGAGLVQDYEAAQLQALKTGLLVAAAVALLAVPFTRILPSR